MKIAFSKVAANEIPFDISLGGVNFNGKLKRLKENLVKCDANLHGYTDHNCDRCGDDMSLELKESIELLLSDGIYKDSEERLDDVVEFFDGFINLDEILVSEIEAYKSDYFYCEKCKNL